jgi:hypothetical protein
LLPKQVVAGSIPVARSKEHPMSKPQTYTQCKMANTETGGTHVAWIPTKFAQRGRLLIFDTMPDKHIVREVWGSLPAKTVLERERLYLKHREFTDI